MIAVAPSTASTKFGGGTYWSKNTSTATYPTTFSTSDGPVLGTVTIYVRPDATESQEVPEDEGPAEIQPLPLPTPVAVPVCVNRGWPSTTYRTEIKPRAPPGAIHFCRMSVMVVVIGAGRLPDAPSQGAGRQGTSEEIGKTGFDSPMRLLLMTDKVGPMATADVNDEVIGIPPIPQSAQLALEYMIWLLERDGIKFRNGKTALFWHLVMTVGKHISDEK